MNEVISDDYISPQPIYDAIFPDIHEWALARKKERGGLPESSADSFTSAAKEPVVPFAPLSREIGVSPVEDTEIIEMTLERQQKISNWVGLVKSPFDLIQRAEGFETPIFVYYAGQKRAVKNIENGVMKATKRSSAGRAAVRREYDTTLIHYEIAKDRVSNAEISLRNLKEEKDLSWDDQVIIIDILQELANGLAANLDDKFPGGDLEARKAGNSILGVASGIEKGTVDLSTQKRLLYAAIGYIKKQERLWNRKLDVIYNFAAEKGFAISTERNVTDT